MSDLKRAQDLAAFAALLSDPIAKRITETMAATHLVEDVAARRTMQQALGLGFTAAAADAMQAAMGNGQSGVFRDVSVERDGAIIGRFTGGHTGLVESLGERLVHATADVPALPAPRQA